MAQGTVRRPGRRVVKKKLPKTVKAYQAVVDQEVAALLDLMETTWGFRPQVTVEVERLFRVGINFNLKGFAHKGGCKYVRPETGNHRYAPATVVRALMSELITHRNTCKECGETTKTLYEKYYVLAGLVGEKSSYFGTCYRTDDNGRQQRINMSNEDDLAWFEANYTTPPDAVEMAVMPGRAKKVAAMLKVWHGKSKPKDMRVQFSTVPPGDVFGRMPGSRAEMRLPVPLTVGTATFNAISESGRSYYLLDTDMVYMGVITENEKEYKQWQDNKS